MAFSAKPSCENTSSALGKSRPGDLVYGSFGVGNLTHLAGELLRKDLNVVHPDEVVILLH